MKVTIKLFGASEVNPRFVGTLELNAAGAPGTLTPEKLSGKDIRLLWDVERAINDTAKIRCHIETSD